VPARQRGQISDWRVHRWARSPNRWWRRAALVCTVLLNRRSVGGQGDSRRPLAVAELLDGDRDDMVVKGMSWALRELIPVDCRAVQRFLRRHDAVLAARVKREVRRCDPACGEGGCPSGRNGASSPCVRVLHTRLQLALRQAVAERDLDAALAERGELGTMIGDLVRRDAEAFGVMLHSVSVRDFMVGANLRTAFADVVAARQQGLAALERARGESAAVRNLANTAQLMEKHPGIMQLRLLQAVESGSGNRIVIALDPERGRALRPDVTAEEDV
jgi:hypothetical protein